MKKLQRRALERFVAEEFRRNLIPGVCEQVEREILYGKSAARKWTAKEMIRFAKGAKWKKVPGFKRPMYDGQRPRTWAPKIPKAATTGTVPQGILFEGAKERKGKR